MKFNSAYPSLLGGVSQRPPGLRRLDQHGEQVNMIADPVRGLTRRQGSRLLAAQALGTINLPDTLADADGFQEIDLQAGASDITACYRKGVKPDGSALAVVQAFNRRTGELFPVVAKPGDPGLSLLESGGVSAAVALGRFLLLAGNTMTPTYSRTDQWAAPANLKLHTVWVRGGAYSRTFSMALIRGNQKFWIAYTTRSASYPDTLDTSDLLPTDPDYAKKVNDRTNEYNSRALRWAGEALKDATPENVASRLADELRTSGFLSPASTVTVVGTTVCITDDSIEEVEALDGGDGSLMRAAGNVVGAPELLTTVGYPGKVIKVLPTNTEQSAAFYLRAAAKDNSTGNFTTVTWEEAAGVLFEVTRAFAFGTIDAGTLYLSTDSDWLEAQTGVTFPRFQASVTGDDDSNAPPEFLKDARVTLLGVFQDRLVIGAGNAVTTSRTGDYLNFFPASLLTVNDADPVNFGIIGGEDDTLRRALVYDRSLILVGDKRQYVINGRVAMTPSTTSATIFSHIPDTGGVQPVASGNYLFIVKSAGGSVSLQQIERGQIEEAPNAQELTQDLDSYIAGMARSLAANVTPDVVLVRAAARNSIFVFQYRDAGRERTLAAWQRWDLGGPSAANSAIVGMSVADEALLVMRLVANGASPFLVVERIALTGAEGAHPYLDLASQAATPTGLFTPTAGALTALGPTGGYLGCKMGVTSITSAWYGYAMTGYVALTSPTMKAQEGIGMIGGDLIVGNLRVRLGATGGVVYRVSTPSEPPLVMAYGGMAALYPQGFDPRVGTCEERADRAMVMDFLFNSTSGGPVQALGALPADTSLPQVTQVHGIEREVISYATMTGLQTGHPGAPVQVGMAALDASEPVPSTAPLAVGDHRATPSYEASSLPLLVRALIPTPAGYTLSCLGATGTGYGQAGNALMHVGPDETNGFRFLASWGIWGGQTPVIEQMVWDATNLISDSRQTVTVAGNFLLLAYLPVPFAGVTGGEAVSTPAVSGAKRYLEVKFEDVGTSATGAWYTFCLRDGAGHEYVLAGEFLTPSFTPPGGLRIHLALDTETGLLWYRRPPITANGPSDPNAWVGLGSAFGDPATGAGAPGIPTGLTAGNVVFVMRFPAGPSTRAEATIYTKPADFEGPIPSGFIPWGVTGYATALPAVSITRQPAGFEDCCAPSPPASISCGPPTVVGPAPGAWAPPPPWGAVPAVSDQDEPYDMDDYMLAEQDPAIEVVTRTGPRAKSRLTIPVAAAASDYTVTLASYLWTPISITGIEYDGRYFGNVRRI